jgi:hypothetical protein
MHVMYFLCAGICLLVIAVIFGLWIRHKRRDQADQDRQDEQIRLSIIQTEAHAVQVQTQKFEAAMKKPQKRKKRKMQMRQKAVRAVQYGSTQEIGKCRKIRGRASR